MAAKDDDSKDHVLMRCKLGELEVSVSGNYIRCVHSIAALITAYQAEDEDDSDAASLIAELLGGDEEEEGDPTLN